MYLLFDIGGTKMRLALSSDGKTVEKPMILPTPQHFEQAMSIFADATKSLTFGRKITAAAGGIAGPLDKTKSVLAGSSHLSDWTYKPLKDQLQKVTGAPVRLENDAAIGGLGVANSEFGQSYNTVAYLTISTGVGGVRIVNGKIDQNSLGFEPGHQVIVANGSRCPGCDGAGHLESYVSGSAIEKKYGKVPEQIKDSKIWDEVAQYLAIGLNNITVLWSPDIIVLGGSVSNSIPILNVKSYLDRDLNIFPHPPEVIQTKLGETVGLYGALQLLKN